MYLKSLVLKGFKSFADRSVLNLEPGITAVVGPNGSGKSNISDAVLWVLGERNAKNLRGQVMEDVIFAGSSKRRSVNIAEVSLVLDNSDGALPVEYNEVSITRRMYRTGESEYLINGTLARRMDILDILHDSGLGTGTHSIISQGHLDSILQSKPEDRRALIEEAAGVLKHKQRKAKSARKLEQMDLHLARVNDVVGEVKRQLGPLERKAKRALSYKEVSAELAQVSLQLAVDDLRLFQKQYQTCEQEEQKLTRMLDEKRSDIEAAEQNAEALQVQFAQDSNDTMGVVRSSQRMSACIQRLDASISLLEQRKTQAKGRSEEFLSQSTSLEQKIIQQDEELLQLDEQLHELTEQQNTAQQKQEELLEDYETQKTLVKELLRTENAAETLSLSLSDKLDQGTKQLAQKRELLAAGEGKIASIHARINDLKSQLRDLYQNVNQAIATRDEQTKRSETCKAQARERAEELDQARQACTQAKSALDEIREQVQRLQAELFGIEEIERMLVLEAGPAYAWAAEQHEQDGTMPSPLAHLIHAPKQWETLVERLLADDVTSLLVRDAHRVRELGLALETQKKTGLLTLLMSEDAARFSENAREYAQTHNTTALIDVLEVEPQAQDAVYALLGDVVVCASLDEALDCHARSSMALRFATQDGVIVFPSGKVCCGISENQSEDSALERSRRYHEVQTALAAAREKLESQQQMLSCCEEKLISAQDASLAAEQEAAKTQGQLSAACADVISAQAKQSALEQELRDTVSNLAVVQESHQASKPDVEKLSAANAKISAQLDDAKAKLILAREVLTPAQAREQELQSAYSEARLAQAMLSERIQRIEYSKTSLLRQRQDNEAAIERNRQASIKYQLIAAYAQPVLERLQMIVQQGTQRHETIEHMVAQAQASSLQLSEQQAAARALARQTHDAYDGMNAKLSDVRVEKGRLEYQVQATVNQIVGECATSIEAALELPTLDDREQAEQTAAKLRSRIAKMGTINPDAAAEYEQLKERYDYLSEQLADLHAARQALAKIDRVIEARMKDDFANTFVKVNENFQQIFAVLFPGGQAHLAYSNPDDIDTTGVEVIAQPRGKRVMKMSLMSGGEKSLVALALLFAVYQIRSAPFYILDEVEAALDDTNLRRLVSYLELTRNSTQLIMITHQRRTMEMADVLFGVSMQSDGISKVISQKLDHALRYAE